METPIKKTSKRVDRSLLNEDIAAANVRLVGADGGQRGIVSRAEALAEAKASGLDLVLVAAEANPPVCKVMDYGKHLFELKKTKAAQRKKQKQIQVKEMKFRPGTEEGELNQLHSEFHPIPKPNHCSAKDVEQKAWDIFTLTGQSVVVTLGANGTLAVHNNTLLTVPALAISPVDTVGAGDAFTGAFTAALDRGETFLVALRWGNVAGGLACLETGAQSSLPTAAQIFEHLTALPRT